MKSTIRNTLIREKETIECYALPEPAMNRLLVKLNVFTLKKLFLEIKAKEKTIFELSQLEFYYFKIRIEKKESPLVVSKLLK